MSESTPLRIGELSRLTGKTARTLHFYEELGLLRPQSRTKGGFRLYSTNAPLRVRWVERLQELGFSLKEVQDFLSQLDAKAHAPEAMEELRDFYREKRDEVREQLQRLRRLEQDLDSSIAYLEGCRSCDPLTLRHECSVCGHDGEHAPALVAAVHDG